MKIGQKYSFITDEDHPSPYFVVCAIDSEQGVDIASIFIGGLRFKNSMTDSGYGTEISHAPVQVQSLLDSNPSLIAENVEIPDYQEGYKVWREAFEAGEAGYFTISAADVVKTIVSVANS